MFYCFLFIAFIVCHSLPRFCAFDKTCEKGPLRVKLAMFFNLTVFIWSRNPVMCMVDVFMISPWCIPSGWRTISIIVYTWEICRWRRWSRFATLGGAFVDQRLFFEAQFPMGHQETSPRLSAFFLCGSGYPQVGRKYILPQYIPWSTNHFPSAACWGDEADPVSALSILASEERALRDA